MPNYLGDIPTYRLQKIAGRLSAKLTQILSNVSKANARALSSGRLPGETGLSASLNPRLAPGFHLRLDMNERTFDHARAADVAKTLSAIERLKPDFVNATIAELAIRDSFKPIIGTALVEAAALLKSI